MNAIVLIALKRPYTFVVLAVLILIFGGRAALRTPTDIFPNIGIPVVAVVWTYSGLTPEDMSGRVVYYYERALTTTVGNIEHIESQSLYGRGIIKIYFQPGTDVAAAQAVSAALAKQDIVLPAGDQKIGAIDFLVQTNAQPVDVATFNSLPIKKVGDTVVTVGDVANVYLGGQPQTNAVLVRGRQAVLLEVLKAGDASTLAIVAGVKAKIPEIERTLPPGVKITVLNDASTFVRASIEDVVQEMVTAGVLTGLIVLLFLGSGRSTMIVATSIPLSILCSILALSWAGQTINIMTLGGLALAVGILVDDATVMIENIDAHLEQGLELEPAIIEAANQIVIPTFVSTLCICIVWLPLFQLSGVSGYLFLPLAEAIIFAMIASFILSRTLVPTMAAFLLRAQVAAHKTGGKPKGFFGRLQGRFEQRFEFLRERYRELLTKAVARRGRFILGFLAAALASVIVLIPWLGQDFFPGIKSGEIDMHFRAPIGMRLEEASKVASLVDTALRQLLPGHITNVIDNCGLPNSGLNQA